MGENLQSIQYTRDKRSPVPKSEGTSKVMSANKAKNTKPELLLRKALCHSGLSGYRLHWEKASGRPDIAFPGKKIAVFVNGCYWHRCPYCKLSTPKTNEKFWEEKFEKNKKRDKEKKVILESNGWKVFVFWECEIKEDLNSCIEKISEFIQKQSKKG